MLEWAGFSAGGPDFQRVQPTGKPTAGNREKALILAGGFALLALVLQFLSLEDLLLETVDAAFRVDQLLASGEEWMTARTDFHAQVALMRGARFKGASASTRDVNFLIDGMDSSFHETL